MTDPDWTHPKLQSLISQNARLRIELMIINDLVDDPEYEMSAMDMDYETELVTKIQKLVKNRT